MARQSSVFITGGAQGIGWAVAQVFLAAGWDVVIADVNASALEERRGGAGNGLRTVHMDVRDDGSVRDAVAAATAGPGVLKAFVNNAGLTRLTPMAGIDWSAWNEVMAVNLAGAVRCLSEVGKALLEQGQGGAIVNIASISAERGIPHRGPYTAAKAALVALTRTAAVEWAPHGVRVNAVAPGYVRTELTDRLRETGQLQVEPLLEMIPMKRFAEPDEIAQAVWFLASDAASYVTGQTLFVDGGYLAESGIPGGSGS